MPEAASEQISAFITHWQNSGAAERANYQMVLSKLCEIIEVPRPDPTSPDTTKNLYVFDRAITRTHPDGSTTTNYINLYKARHFVNETKQGLSAPETNVAAVYDRRANEEAPSLSSIGIDGRRPTLQGTSLAIDGHRPTLQTKSSLAPAANTKAQRSNHRHPCHPQGSRPYRVTGSEP